MNAITPKLGRTSLNLGEAQIVYDARELIADGVKTHIHLDGQVYTLRITRAGKLILTK